MQKSGLDAANKEHEMNNGWDWPLILMICWIGGGYWLMRRELVVPFFLWAGFFPITSVVILVTQLD